MENLISSKDLKALIAKNKKKVKAYRDKEGNSFLCSGGPSELISCLAVMKELGGGDLYIRIAGDDIPNDPYENTKTLFSTFSPYLEIGFFNNNNIYTFDYFKPLLEQQPYIKSVNIYKGSEVTFNLDEYRYCYFNKEYLDKTQGIKLNVFNEIWGLKLSFASPWLFVEGEHEPDYKILVGRSVKNQGGDMGYRSLAPLLTDNAFFYGTDLEYKCFGVACCITRRLKPESLVNLAQTIKGMETIITNESILYWLSLALNAKEIHYELCPDLYNGINDNSNVKYFLGDTYVTPQVDFSKRKKTKNKISKK